MFPRTILLTSENATSAAWVPTTLDKIGRHEAFIENAIAENIELLGIQTLRSHIYGPYKVYRQSSLPTPNGRTILPDLVALSTSGHIIAVEVKRESNPELKNRDVIAQIIDYAASLNSLDERGALNLFGRDAVGATSWEEAVSQLLPESDDPRELAETLLGRLRRAEIELVIACDRAPSGLAETIRGIASTPTLGFELHLVELVPYVRTGSDASEVLFVPATRIATQIVARTHVTIAYRAGDAEPVARVETTSVEEIEENVKAAEMTAAKGRVWTKEEVIQDFEENGNDVERALLAFTAAHGAGGIGVSPALKANATFGFYVAGVLADGRTAKWMLFFCARGWQFLEMKLNVVEQLAGEAVHKALVGDLSRLFGESVALHQKVPRIPLALLRTKLPEFEKAILRVADRIAARLHESNPD